MKPDGLYWIVGPDYEQSRAEFDYVLEDLQRLELVRGERVSKPRQGSWGIETVVGGQIITKTSADVLKLASVAPDGILMAEAAQQEYESYLRLRGRVSEKRGPLFLVGTFESSLGWYAELWKKWQVENADGGRSFSLPTWSNTNIFPGGREDPEIKALEASYPKEKFDERFGAVPCPPSGLVFREFSYFEHVDEQADWWPEVGVQLWVDPGYAYAYAVEAVQIIRGCDVHGNDVCVHVIDEVYERGRTAQEIIAMVKGKPWWRDVRALVMDAASKQHPGADAQADIWYQETGLIAVTNKVPIVDGILRLRTFLKNPETQRPRLYHHPRCQGVIQEYGLYRYATDSARAPATEIPIDRDNHAIKALTYGLVANFGFVETFAMAIPEVSVKIRRT